MKLMELNESGLDLWSRGLLQKNLLHSIAALPKDVSAFSSVITERLQCDPEAYESSIYSAEEYMKNVRSFAEIFCTIRH